MVDYRFLIESLKAHIVTLQDQVDFMKFELSQYRNGENNRPDYLQAVRVYCKNCVYFEKGFDEDCMAGVCTVPGNVSMWYSDTGEGRTHFLSPIDKNSKNDCPDFIKKGVQ